MFVLQSGKQQTKPETFNLANSLAMHDNVGMVSKHLLRCAPWSVLLIAAGIFFVSSPSFGQKTDVNINLYGTFPMSASASPQNAGNPPLEQTADSSLGFRIGARHIFSPILGLELNFGYNRANQYFVGNSIQTGVVYSHAKPFTVDYVASVPFSFHGIQPFVLAGGGFISYNISSYIAAPPGGGLPAKPEKIPVFEYGLGADFHPGLLPPFMALRIQYRGLVGHAPDYRLPYLATSNLINIAEPQAGLVFKF
jgi:hypothetical protein